jgi:poly-gamma-glutamate synthesis protein (capsule biosynthesis protein)
MTPGPIARRSVLALPLAETIRAEGATPMLALALTGDVMLGRGIDQVLPHPGDPVLHERFVHSALGYVQLAERRNGRIQRPVSFGYVWGDALDALKAADARIVNLETAVTTSPTPEPKGINYRMHPANIGCLRAADITCCALANNHVLDWGGAGLLETLETLERAGIGTAGAGRDAARAEAPAMIEPGTGGRVLVFACGTTDSGIPRTWAAAPGRPGVHLLADLSVRTVEGLAALLRAARRPGDIAIVSVHWGPNWGYDVPSAVRDAAHALVERAGFDIVHGHSSHHPLGIEVHRDRLILYGAGDFLNDYEGIEGYEAFRGDLVLLYLPRLAASGELLGLRMLPFQLRRFRLHRASAEDAEWLRAMLDRESRRFGAQVTAEGDGAFELAWRRDA